MKRFKKIIACLTAAALGLSLTGCSTGNRYLDLAGSFIERTVSAVSETAGSRMKEFSEKLSQGPKDGDLEAFLEELLTGQDSTANDGSAPSRKPEEHASADNNASGGPSAGSSSSDPDSTSAESPDSSTDSADRPDSSHSSGASEEDGFAPPSKLESTYVPEYVHYDKEQFNSLCDEFAEAGKNNDAEKTKELYDHLIQELKVVGTMDTVAFLNYCRNINDKYYDEEYTYTELAYTDCYDRFMISCRVVMESSGAEAFEKHADASILEEAEDYEAMTEETKALLDREKQLESDYDKAVDSAGDITYELKGKTYSFDQLYEEVSPLSMLAMYNYNDFLKVYEGLLKKANESIGPIYVELLQVRKDLAKAYGYDNYADYCYENIYGRQYTTKDAEEFCNVIKENIGSRFYDSGAAGYIYNSEKYYTEFSLEEMFDIVDRITKGFDPEINDSFHELLDKKLYDIGYGDGRYAGSYTSTLYTEGLPFIFINEENTAAGLATLEHEFGHFTNALYEQKDPDSFYRDENFDVMEIHSNGLQLLCSNHYGEILDEQEAEEAVRYEIAFQLYSVLDGCIYDEFQRAAYEDPDMTLEELNSLYGEICAEYGQTPTPGNQYMWIFITHTFESPMYYISYAVSALSAIEIWQISRTLGEAKAVDLWLDLMHEKDDEDYETVLEKVGLTPFTDSKGAVKILSDAIDTLLGEDLVTVPEESAA